MSLARRLTALLLMFAWIFATGHLCMDHAGEVAASHACQPAAPADDHHHHGEGGSDAPGLPAEHHHHQELGLARDSHAGLLKVPSAAFVLLTLLLPESAWTETLPAPAIVDPPPDERRCGYLLVVQTAQPVRGPSPVA